MKRITLGMLFCMLSVCAGFSQVQVGSGMNLGQNVPINTSKNYSYSQSIYLSSSINAVGTITSLQWYFAGTSPLTNNQELVVYMGTTEKTNFTSTTDWVASTGLTQVYAGGIVTDASPGWKTITLTTPFAYDGMNNLVIAVDENAALSDGTSFKFRNFNTSETRSISYANNSINPDPLSPPTSGTSSLSSSSYVPNIILGGLNQLCITPLNISFSSINDTSFDVSWESQGTAPALGYDIYLSDTNVTPVSGTPASFSVAAGQTTFTITGLTPLTTYYLWIKSKCSATEVSAFSELKTVVTSATPVTAFFESFESAAIPNLPLGWSKIVRGPSLASTADVKTSTTGINITPQSVQFTSGASTFLDDIMLVSTNVSNIAAANNRLKLYARGTGMIQVGTLSTNDENAVFTVVEEIAITGTNALYQVAFDYAISTDHYIGIRLVTTGSSLNTYVDDIRWEAIPVCADVTEVAVPVVTSTSATVNWISNTGGESAWNVAIAPSTTLTPEGLPFFTTVVTGSYNAIDLLENTEYKVWVRSVCGSDNGAWIGPVVFRTDCTATTSFTENFDTSTALTLPNCWGKIVRGAFISASANVRTIASNANSGSNSLQLLNSTSSGAFDVIAVSPRLSTLELGTYRIKFFAKGVGVLQIGTVDNATNAGTFTTINSVTTTAAYDEYAVDFTTYTGTDTHFGIRLASETTNNIVYIDDVIWELAPLCADVTAIEVNAITPNSATINWAENLGIGSWNIAIGGSTDTDPSLLTPFFESSTQGVYNATGLDSNTNYNVWVRSVCGTNLGAWIGPIAFKTSCIAVNTVSENFDAVTVPGLPDCWSSVISGASVSTSASVTSFALSSAQSAPNVVKLFNSGSSGTYDIMLISPYMNSSVVNGSRVKFHAKSLTVGGALDIVTLNSNAANAAYTVIETIALTTTMADYVVNLGAAASTDSYVGFRLNATSGYKTVYVDNIIIEAIPTCLDVSGLAISDITATAAVLEWTSNGNETAWDVAIGPNTSTDPSSQTIVTTDFNSYSFSDLTASTLYKVWVRSVCSGENGAWIGPLSFGTGCNPATTLDENFNSTVFPNLPICWTNFISPGANSSSNVAVSSGGFQNTNAVTIYAANSSAGADVVLITPALSNLGTANQLLTFKAAGSNSIVVGTLNSNSSDIVFTPFQTFSLTESFQDISVDFSTYTGTNTYIGIGIVTGSTSTSSQYVAVDNLAWGPNLGNENFDTTKSMLYPNPVNSILNIKTTKELVSVSVYNIMGQQVLTTTQNLSQIDMSGLSNGAYLVKLNGGTFTETLKVIKN